MSRSRSEVAMADQGPEVVVVGRWAGIDLVILELRTGR